MILTAWWLGWWMTEDAHAAEQAASQCLAWWTLGTLLYFDRFSSYLLTTCSIYWQPHRACVDIRRSIRIRYFLSFSPLYFLYSRQGCPDEEFSDRGVGWRVAPIVFVEEQEKCIWFSLEPDRWGGLLVGRLSPSQFSLFVSALLWFLQVAQN